MEKIIDLTIYKPQITHHKIYGTKAWAPILTHGDWSFILRLKGTQRKETTIIKRLKIKIIGGN